MWVSVHYVSTERGVSWGQTGTESGVVERLTGLQLGFLVPIESVFPRGRAETEGTVACSINFRKFHAFLKRFVLISLTFCSHCMKVPLKDPQNIFPMRYPPLAGTFFSLRHQNFINLATLPRVIFASAATPSKVERTKRRWRGRSGGEGEFLLRPGSAWLVLPRNDGLLGNREYFLATLIKRLSSSSGSSSYVFFSPRYIFLMYDKFQQIAL